MSKWFLIQDRDIITDSLDKLKHVTISKPSDTELSDLLFASKYVNIQNLTPSFFPKTYNY